MEGALAIGGGPVDQSLLQQQQQQQQQQPRVVERLNPAVQQQLNLESVKIRATSLFKAISRILEDFDAIARTNAITPKWQDILSQFSMVNLELFNIVEDIKKVSKAFVVYPKNVNAENASILPVMLSTKLFPEMEMEDNSKREQLLHGMQNLPVSAQIEKIKTRIDMIGAACESAEKVIVDTRKAYFSTRQGPTTLPTIDKAQTAKIQEQENLLRHAVNHGEGLRVPGDQRQVTSSLPAHLVDVLTINDHSQAFADSSGMYLKNTPLSSNSNSQGTMLQASGAQLMGRAVASPSAGSTSFDNTTASPLPYANSPRSGANVMNTPSPQQQTHQQHQQQLQQQRQKIMQLPQHQQLLSQQQFRQSAVPGIGQNQLSQMHDLQGQSQQKFQSMQFSQPLATQQFQARQLASGAMQHGMSQSQLNQGNQLNRHMNQFSNPASSQLFNAAQTTPNSQMISNMPAMMPSQTMLPRMQFPMSGGSRGLASQNLSDQIFNMGVTNPGNMMPIQPQQQHSSQGGFGNMSQGSQNLQPGMVPLQNTTQNHPSFQQQRQQNQQ